ncbi:MAG TPA: ATP-binding protein [Thermoanaerobaculia bacterium]|jgi:predicted kinase
MELELIIFVGLQGSGKTTWYHEHFAATHVHVSKDLMPNARNRETRQQQQIEEALSAGRSVVVDNTNPSIESRAPLVAAGHRLGARVVAVYFEAHVPTSLIRNRAREGKARVPDVAIFRTKKQLAPPSLDEGFDEVRIVPAQA